LKRCIKQYLAILLSALAVTGTLHAQQSNEIRLTKQPGFSYLPAVIMEENKLIEKHARAMGLNGLKVSWLNFTNGGAATDALLAGNIDIVTSGGTNLLLLWSKTHGTVKGIAGLGATPSTLVTRNPKIKTLADYTPQDKIAVPTVKVSTQAILLQMAAEKQFGQAGLERVNAMTISMGHADAMITLQSKNEQITSHFSQPPYVAMELKLPGAHQVANMTTAEIGGGPISNGVAFGTVKFHDNNPKLIAAFLAALNESIELIKNDKQAAAEIYLQSTKEKMSVPELVEMLNDPDVIFSSAPLGTMKIADFMARAGYIKPRPKDWKDYFFPEIHKLPGS
jgi:NitT/TauT family transport system substrate-binding protein